MRLASVRSLIVALVVPLALTGCGSDDGKPASSAGSSTTSKASDDDEPLDGEYTQPGLAGDASVADFCKAMAEVDTAIDDAHKPGVDQGDAWLRIVAAIDAVWETGAPADLPPAGIDEIEHIDRLIRQSNSVAELTDAIRNDPPQSRTVDTWLSDNCTN